MAIEDELDDFFSMDASCVVKDHDKFKMKLNIGSEAFAYLTQAENLGDFVSALEGPVEELLLAFIQDSSLPSVYLAM